MEHPVLLYDGVCGLCNWTVQFVLRRDGEKRFRFAPLQSAFAARLLGKKGVDASDLSSVYIAVFREQGEILLMQSDAVLWVMEKLPGIWPGVARVLRFVPRTVRDWGYRVIARSRYQLFGKYDTCPIPSESDRERFIEV
ncbi:MAG TPA: DCC1-like thiol-disulfide oxidoreductase family protein [Candidatus Sulfotelmatobacter sp.]|nr:DCC1-like thiol-disulfide oxidoreductase family protein [Candidatus Sulfotelmatobacter sp.]